MKIIKFNNYLLRHSQQQVGKPEYKSYPDGQKVWKLNGEFHRIGGPAIVYPDGRESWYYDGMLHREDGGPAKTSMYSKEWWYFNKQHREDGPAVEYNDGRKEYWLGGRQYSEEQYNSIDPSERAKFRPHR